MWTDNKPGHAAIRRARNRAADDNDDDGRDCERNTRIWHNARTEFRMGSNIASMDKTIRRQSAIRENIPAKRVQRNTVKPVQLGASDRTVPMDLQRSIADSRNAKDAQRKPDKINSHVYSIVRRARTDPDTARSDDDRHAHVRHGWKRDTGKHQLQMILFFSIFFYV